MQHAQSPLWWWAHAAYHGVAAGISVGALYFRLVSIEFGLPWECHVVWLLFVLLMTLSQVATMVRHGQALGMVSVAKAVVMPVMPICGELLDMYKDWNVVAISFQSGGYMGVGVGVAGILVLAVSNFLMRHWYCPDLRKHYLAMVEEGLARPSGPGGSCVAGVMADAVTDAKLCVAISEDLPQAPNEVVCLSYP